MGVQKGKWPEMSICTQDMQGRSWHLYFNEDEARKVYQALHQVFGN
jgi:hypothetical protein